ncbi:MAG: hypothetical protein SGILL_009952, partial [Bacillariaceae sp.]
MKDIHTLVSDLQTRIAYLEQEVKELQIEENRRRLQDDLCTPRFREVRDENNTLVEQFCEFQDQTYVFPNRTEFGEDGRVVFEGKSFFNGFLTVNGDIRFDDDSTCMPVYNPTTDRCHVKDRVVHERSVSFDDPAYFNDKTYFRNEVSFDKNVTFADGVVFDPRNDKDVRFKGRARAVVDTKRDFLVKTKTVIDAKPHKDSEEIFVLKKGRLILEDGDLKIEEGNLRVDRDVTIGDDLDVRGDIKTQTLRIVDDFGSKDSSDDNRHSATLTYSRDNEYPNGFVGLAVSDPLYAPRLVTNTIDADEYLGDFPAVPGGDLTVNTLTVGGVNGVKLKYGAQTVLGRTFNGLVVEGDAYATRLGAGAFGSNQ